MIFSDSIMLTAHSSNFANLRATELDSERTRPIPDMGVEEAWEEDGRVLDPLGVEAHFGGAGAVLGVTACWPVVAGVRPACDEVLAALAGNIMRPTPGV